MTVPILGIALIALAALVPSSAWIDVLRSSPPELRETLLRGGSLFRGGLAALGAYLVLGWRLGWWSGKPLPPDPGPPRSGNRSLLLLAALLAIATALRLYGLGRGLWLDEVLTLVRYARPPFGEILTTFDSQNQHTLYSLLAHACLRLFGESAWALRLPAALFGAATVWALFALARQVADTREALLSAALLTVSYQHVWFSQNARGYSGLLFWTVLSSHAFLRGLRQSRRDVWLGYAITASLGLYTHLTMVFVVLGQLAAYLVWMLSRRRPSAPAAWVPFTDGFVLAGLLTLVLYAFVLPQILETIGGESSWVATWTSPWWTIRETLRGLGLGSRLGVAALGAGAVVVVAGCVAYLRSEPGIVVLLIVPVVLGAGVTTAMGHHLWPRFFFFAEGFAILVVVRGLTVLAAAAVRALQWPPSRGPAAATAVTLGLIVVMAPSLTSAYRPKQDYAGARDFVNQAMAPGDAVVAVGLATIAFRYYAPDWVSISSLRELDAIRARSRRTWLLYTLPPVMEARHPDILSAVRRDFRLIRTFDGSLSSGSILVYRADGRPSADGSAPTPEGKS